jgi:hypothetical protein
VRVEKVFTTSFGFGPLFVCVGLIFLTIATYLVARHYRSLLLHIAALGFLVCAFSTVASVVMPIQLRGNVWPPHWVSWLALVGSPIAVLVAGTAALTFVVLHARSRT